MSSVHNRPGQVRFPKGDVAPTSVPAGAPLAPSSAPPKKTPADVFQVHSPGGSQLGGPTSTAFPGYRWAVKDVDAVMAQYAIGDAHTLIQTAVALDNGNRTLSLKELLGAAQQLTAARNPDLKWSPAMMADIMKQRGVASTTAMLAEARRQDNGDKVLSRAELDAAAVVLTRTIGAHDADGVVARVLELQAQHNLDVQVLGVAGKHPVQAVHLPATGDGPVKMRVLVTGGVHGDEPCGPAATMLLLEQLLNNPDIRRDTEFTIVPLVNPRGLVDGTRRTPDGVDLNRNFSHDETAPTEVHHISALLKQKDYTLALDLHSGRDDRNGFWVLHKASAELMEPAVERFQKHWPVLTGDTDKYNMAKPGIGESSNPNTLKDFASQDGARWSVTLEAPGSVGYLDQVVGQNDLANQIIVEAHRRLA